MQCPRKLRKGDKVAIVSLSSGMLGEEFCSHNVEMYFVGGVMVMKIKNSMFIVHDAALTDAERILEIYNYYVKNTAITFE